MTKKLQDLVYELTDKEIQRLFAVLNDEESEIKLEDLKRKYFTYKELMLFADKLNEILIETTQTDFDDILYQDQIQNAQCALEVLTILQNVYKRTINAKQRIDE